MAEVSAAGVQEAAGAEASFGASVPAAPRPTIAEQIEEVARELRMRERLYPEWTLKGRLKQVTANKKLRDLKAAHLSLLAIQKHTDGLRLLISVLQRVDKFGAFDEKRAISNDEAKALLDIPEVKAVVDAFPGVEFADIRPLTKTNFDFLQSLDDEVICG